MLPGVDDLMRQDTAATAVPAPPAPTAPTWHHREPSLPAVAVIGVGAVAAVLAEATRARLADVFELRAVADPEYLVVLGAEQHLPWVDGARYLGWEGTTLTLTTHIVEPALEFQRQTAIGPDGDTAGRLRVVLPERVLELDMPTRAADVAVLAQAFPVRT